MQLGTKAQIAQASFSLLVIVASLFFLGVLVLVLCAGLEINPFRETTTSFLLAVFAGLAGTAAVLVLLNVASNISLIADAKIAELQIQPQKRVPRKWLFAFGLATVTLVVLIFAGTYLSKERFLRVVRNQADEVLHANENLLEEISQRLLSGKADDYKRIAEIRTFLQSQRSGLPELSVIYSAEFSDKPTFYRVNPYFPESQGNTTYVPTYFPCTQNVDCDYLKMFFSGGKADILQKYSLRGDDFYIYIPFLGKEKRFILLFERTNRYGKFGS
jgi:hypothetical protein